MNCPLLTVRDVALRLGTSVLTVRRWVREGRVPSYRTGGRFVRLHWDEVAEALRHPVRSPQPDSPDQVADFAVTPSGLARGGYRERRGEEGGISGRVVAADGLDAARLAGVGVMLDGRWRGELDASGRFAIGQLADGVYALSLDSGKLPLEYQPADPVRRVEVRAGAATRVDFGLDLRLGFAGRVLGADGAPLAQHALEVFDPTGARVAGARTDAWGYYRVDGLPAGRYRVQAAGGAARDVRLGREFAFGIDLDAGTTP